MTTDAVVLRAYVADSDHNFILSSWLKSFHGSKFAGSLAADVYWTAYGETIRRLLADPDIKVTVACTTDDADQILGYIVHADSARAPVVHYLYVKQTFRRLGIARQLMNKVLADRKYFAYSFRTPAVAYLPAAYSAQYDPKATRRIGNHQRQDCQVTPATLAPQAPR